jgi:hypothetical protein
MDYEKLILSFAFFCVGTDPSGATDVRVSLSRRYLKKALTFPETIGAGKPYLPDMWCLHTGTHQS